MNRRIAYEALEGPEDEIKRLIKKWDVEAQDTKEKEKEHGK